MVKSVFGEETQMKLAEDRLSRSSFLVEVLSCSYSASKPPSFYKPTFSIKMAFDPQVGIIIGKLNPHLDRSFVYDLIPTPPTDVGDPACSLKSEGGGRDDKKKGSKGKIAAEVAASLLIDGEWVAEHARQVSRMLLGGISVIGIYIWSSEASFKATSTLVLSQVIRGVAKAAPDFHSEATERLLVHISYSPRRWACRNCAVASAYLRPCDFKMSKLLASLRTYSCAYSFDIRIPILQDEVFTSNTFKDILRHGISCHAKKLQSARALVDGKLVNEDQQVTSEGLRNVELLLPFKTDAYMEACSSDKISGLVVLKGTVCASAYLSPKEPISQAISDLKNDIINSLRSRLDIVLDEAVDKLDTTSNNVGKESGDLLSGKSIHQLTLHELREPLSLSFPRRVLIPWLSGILVCDYLLPSETFEDLKDRCREMMSIEDPVEWSAFLELETEAVAPVASSFWHVVHQEPLSANEEPKNRRLSTEKKSPGKANSINFSLHAALILVLAVLIGGAVTFFNPAKLVH